MPATSPAQYGIMQMAAKGIGVPSKGKKKIPKKVGKDFIKNTPSSTRSKFAKVLAAQQNNSQQQNQDPDNDND